MPAAHFHVSGIPETWKSGVLLNGEPLPVRCVSKNELEAIIAPKAIPTAGTCIVTLKGEGEAPPEVPSRPSRGGL